MAEQVARVKILAQIEGLEGFDKLKGAFKGLQQAIGPSDQALSKARKEVLAFGEAGARTQQVLRGQVEALKALQAQATIGGAVYKALGRDVKALGEAYNETANQAKRLTDAQLRNQAASNKPSAFQGQIAALKRELGELNVLSAEYATSLANIQRREIRFGMGSARQGVVARNQAFENENFLLPDRLSGQPELPNTTAALNQQMGELNDRLLNLSRGGQRWIETSQEIARIQRELNREFANPAVEAARRRLEQSRAATANSGFLAFSQNADTLGDRIAVDKSIARNAAKQPRPQLELPMMETSELYRSIQGAGLSRISSQLQLMGNSYGQVAADIRKAAAASDGSVNSLRAQRSAWEALRNTLGDNKVALRETAKELAAIDRQLEKRGVGGGGIGSKIQAAGAVASGAIFGGPLGAAGALGGAALGSVVPSLGTVGGAFAGAAIGGAVGGLQQSITGATDYAAQIARLQIALKGVSSSQAEFNDSLKFISDSSGQFLTNLGDATLNYTRLQASVRGAGQGSEETQKVFKGLSAAIIATGGSTEALNAAFTAASQVFSKGKVSAEELRGQIGERLPGAFTIFAQAVGKTPQQLDEALKKGEVSLEDFVRFSEELFKRYGKAAEDIGKSPFAASIRFELAVKNMQLAAGQALLPIATYFTNMGTAAVNALTRVFEGTTNWQQALGRTFDNVRKLTGGVAGLKQILVALTQAFVVLGTTMAAVFAVQNIGTFVNAMRGMLAITQTLIKLTRELLTLEKAITALKAIQGALQAVLTAAANGLKVTKGKAAAVGGIALGAIAAAAFKDQIQTAIGGVVDGIGNTFNDMFKMPALGGELGGAVPSVPTSDAISAEQQKAAEKAERDRQTAAEQQQRLDEETAKAKIELDNRTHQNALEMIRKRYEYERELQNQSAENWVKSYTGAARGAAGIIAGALRGAEDLRNRLRESEVGIITAKQGLKSAEAMAAATAAAAQAAAAGSTQANGYISKEQLRAWLISQGFGRTSGDFTNAGHRTPNHMLNAMDMGVMTGPYDAAVRKTAQMEQILRATGAFGDQLFGPVRDPKGHKDHLHVPTPGGMVPLTPGLAALMGIDGAGSAGGGATQPLRAGQAAVVRRDVGNVGEVAEARANVAKAEALAELEKKQNPRLAELLGTSANLDYTEAIRQQTRELREQAGIQQLRNELLRQGKSPEFIETEVRRAEALRNVAQQLQPAYTKLEQYKEQLAKVTAEEGASSEAAKVLVNDINLLSTFVDSLSAQVPSLTEALDGFARKQKEAADYAKMFSQQFASVSKGAYEDAVNLGKNFGQTFVNGLNSMSDALVEFTMTGKLNFADFARSLIADINRVIMRWLVFETVKAGLNAVSSGLGSKIFGSANGNAFAQNGIQPFARGGIVSNPTLFQFAKGGTMATGVMGEAGPEAIVPLRRGRDGKLGVVAAGGASGGDITVNVAVDASGSKAEGNDQRGQQLGLVIAQAVQAELVKQKRPGGLLAA